jgi:hypothetical protein
MADLLAVIGSDTQLKKVAGTRGGEFAGSCPFCGGTDRFRAHPNWQGGEWHCRNCSPDDRWHSIYDYVMKRDGLTFIEAKEQIDGPGSTKAKAPDDPQQYPAQHGCSWADYAAWGAALVPYIDLRTDKNKQPLPTTGQTFEAILFNDATGGRFRVFNHPDLKFVPLQAGQAPVLYGLSEAVQLANQTGQQMLYLVNGQPSVIACHVHGVPAFTIPGGEGSVAGFLRKGLLQHLLAYWAGPIRVCFDGDKQGYKSAPAVVDVLLAAGYSDVQALDLGQGHDAADLCVLNNGTSVQAFQSLPVLYPLPPPPAPPSNGAAAPTLPLSSRYQIDVTDIDMRNVVQPTWDAVVARNQPATLFRRDTMLMQIVVLDGKAIFRPVDQATMRNIITHACVYIEQKNRRGIPTAVPLLKPDGAIVEDMRTVIDPRIEAVDRIVQVPVFAPDGTLLDAPGYHAAARLYHHPRPGLVVPPIPDQPTQADVAAARSLLYDDLLIDFPFVSNADRTHAIALMLLPFVREMIPGPTPLHLIEAPMPGRGKNLLTEALLTPLLGEAPPATTEASEDEEWRKKLTAALATAPEVMLLDNLNKALDSGALASMLTTTRWTDRILGTSTQVDIPIRCAWVATANNPFTSGEIARRCIRIRIDPRTDRPGLRSGWKHDPLATWTRAHAGELVAACLTLVRYGLQHGTPPKTTLGSFDQWAAVLGQILNACGIDDFLGNLQELYDRADAEGATWREIVAAWWATYGDTEVGVGQIFTLLSEDADLPLRGKDEQAKKTSFGRLLAKKRDNVINGFQILDCGTRNRAHQWKLVRV